MPGYPYTSWIVLVCMIIVILSMPFIRGQATGLIAGLIMTAIYSLTYFALRIMKFLSLKNTPEKRLNMIGYKSRLVEEFSKELIGELNKRK